MKFAIIQEQRHEAQPGLSGHCPSFKADMVAKCGDLRVWHRDSEARLNGRTARTGLGLRAGQTHRRFLSSFGRIILTRSHLRQSVPHLTGLAPE